MKKSEFYKIIRSRFEKIENMRGKEYIDTIIEFLEFIYKYHKVWKHNIQFLNSLYDKAVEFIVRHDLSKCHHLTIDSMDRLYDICHKIIDLVDEPIEIVG
jgi:hypothetical protein